MAQERKILYISVGINFLLGIIMGMMLFYSQLNAQPEAFETVNIYDGHISVMDFLNIAWLNFLWMIFIFLFHNILSVPIFHPVMMLRGCCCSFSVLYMFVFLGIRKAVVIALPQCVSILPLLVVFSVKVVQKRRKLIKNGKDSFSICRKEALLTVLAALMAGGMEVAVLRLLEFCLL